MDAAFADELDLRGVPEGIVRGGGFELLQGIDDRPGIRGVVMGCYPNGTLSVEPEDDVEPAPP